MTDVLRAADLALYRAKRQGRDRVVVWDKTAEPGDQALVSPTRSSIS
jgi:predicted signal transduction protein with EAL and GGDEF domain